MTNRYKKRGWFGESHRHSLAARGIKTTNSGGKGGFFSRKYRKNKKEDDGFETYAKFKGIPIKVEEPEDDKIFPVTPGEVIDVLSDQDDEDIEGINGVEFVNPKGEQKEAWGQYVRSRNTILIFSQPQDGEKVDGMHPAVVKDIIKSYVIPHEVGHHKALEIENITDEDLEMAEARADAHVIGMEPTDRDVKVLKDMR